MTAGELCIRETVIAYENDSITDAARLMRKFHVGDIVIVEESEDGRIPVGILTDRDIVVEIVALQANPDDILIKDVMSKDLLIAKEKDDIYETLERMKDKGVKRVPVVDIYGYLIGILSSDDILELISQELNDLVKIFYKEIDKEEKKLGS
ncbi:CBS domain-containing protein [Nitrosophilus kaiyonis]|uniref:CBS domain-containing protein n=1 Tax=Nitrosophilus kaiyonis TaxID=2930200 RepID=UPI002491E03B|nr:CBS domain-containing protein [Nitrosophilus kaiyonis]